MPILAAAEWYEVVAALVFFLITGIAQYLQKRSRERRGLPPEPEPDVFAGPTAQPRRGLPPVVEERRPVVRDDWQEQLRRMLEGDSPEAKPPPIIAPVAPPVRKTAPLDIPESVSWEDRSSPSGEGVSLDDAKLVDALKDNAAWTAATRLNTGAKMAAAMSAYRQASSLPKIASARLREAQARATRLATPPLPQQTAPAQSLSVRTLLRHPRTLRQVILASEVLHPPKAFE